MNNIKQILKSEGWDEIVKIMHKHFEAIEIPETGALDEIGKRYLAKSMALKSLDGALQELAAIKMEIERKETSYK